MLHNVHDLDKWHYHAMQLMLNEKNMPHACCVDNHFPHHSRAQWEKSNNNHKDYFNHGNREAKFKEFQKQYYRDNFQLDIEYNKYLDYQKKIIELSYQVPLAALRAGKIMVRKKPKLVRPGIDNLGGEEKITSADIV